ncbi:unnamed protein product (macronuclear) [Paramecium tetraurelia]|uniref:Protein kinase domain-containing protein n=1 Tax=Paramecium tetraurelia TaxID=5888 RepID=A0C037_PARTE|nr:uncharacterized protein GSPATT00006007001 [Paramecium tetraurelia]CAK64154.1 unnamed protein product [Paramecium tetraurelia]|eukprot:XP_001431552.1 hypothetical protein (macronuclear) [Paramecium tetraurelia strain d4-2]
MGNTIILEIENSVTSNLLRDQLKYLGIKKHNYLGQIQLWKNKQNQHELIFSKISLVDVDENFINNQHTKRKSMQHENLLQYYGCTIKEQKFQGAIKDFRIYYEFLPTNLQMVLKDHQFNGQFVKESFIWKLITQISTVFAYLDSKNKFHSNINFDSLFFDKAYNVKVLYHGAVPNLLSSYAQTLGNYNSNKSLSPQQMKDYQNHLTQLKINPFKQDSYSLGILLVSIMSGKDVTKQTDFYKEVVHYKQILNILGSAYHYYSQSLMNIVVSLLQYDDVKRPNISQLFKVKIFKSPTIQQRPQLQVVQQHQTINIYRIDTTQSYSSQNHYQSQYHLITPTKKALSITNNTKLYSSPRKASKSSSYEYPKLFQLANGFFTPKAKLSRKPLVKFNHLIQNDDLIKIIY